MRFNVEFSPMASPNFESGRPGEAAIELARLVERSLRETRAIDQEALCVLAGRKVRMQEQFGGATSARWSCWLCKHAGKSVPLEACQVTLGVLNLVHGGLR